ncbi:MAG: MmcQ/YjbR family DNA-binding protein [Oscillospiraceae bacterium]
MTRNAFLDFCRSIPGASTDQPFDEDFETWVARHTLTRKWFALLMKHEGRDIVNLKCDPQEADLLRKLFTGVIPAYHMNKTHWNTIILDSDLPDEEIKRMTLNSFALTDKRK